LTVQNQSEGDSWVRLSTALILNGQGVSTSGWLIIAQLVGLLSAILGFMVFTAKPAKSKGNAKAAKKAAKK
jgi:hypothetical protein